MSVTKRPRNSCSTSAKASELEPVSKKSNSKDIRRFFSSTPITTCTRLVTAGRQLLACIPLIRIRFPSFAQYIIVVDVILRHTVAIVSYTDSEAICYIAAVCIAPRI